MRWDASVGRVPYLAWGGPKLVLTLRERSGISNGELDISDRPRAGIILEFDPMDALTKILQAECGDENFASEELLPLVYDELRYLAASRMAAEAPGQTLQATALVHEAWLKIAGEGGQSWNNRAHFLRAAAQAMRRILVDRARAKMAIKRGEKSELLELQGIDLMETPPDERVLLIDDMLKRLEGEDPDSARVVTLKFFGGLTNIEIAEINGISVRTAARQWAQAKACLFRMIREETS